VELEDGGPQPDGATPRTGAAMAAEAAALAGAIRGCRLCAGRFASTATAHAPRPVVWFHPAARLLVAGQAPGARVHASGRPFTDPSGARLRAWMGVGEAAFYDLSRVAIVPMAFCFPGQDAAGADLPPPPVCARTWRAQVRALLPHVRLVLLVGGAAQDGHLPAGRRPGGVTATVAAWREHAPAVFPLPHPSWRNTSWLRRNPWFAAELVPALQSAVRAVLEDRS
jgi:uracil-DNA glycosylase